jgi:capsular polysaccharide transport system permease protein
LHKLIASVELSHAATELQMTSRASTVSVVAFGRWCSMMLFLTMESIGFRYRRTRLSAALAVLEPVGVVGIFAFAHSLASSIPPFGPSDVLFFTTGIIPFYLFFHISWRTRSWDYLQPIPRVTKFDQLLSHVLAEIFTKVAILAIIYALLLMDGIAQAIPARPIDCFYAMLALAALGVGVGIVNAVIGGFFHAWLYLYAIAMRAWIMFSGVLFVVDWMPPALRDLAVLNPLTHAITWFRVGQYGNYPTLTLDLNYLFLTTTAIVVFGFLIESFTRQWRSAR